LGLYVVAAAYRAGSDVRLEHDAGLLLGTLLATLAANVYIVGLNQLTDVEIDRINKPELPLAAGALSLRAGAALVVASLLLSLLLALLLGRYLLLAVVLGMLVGTLYSLPPVRLKRFHVWAAASIFQRARPGCQPAALSPLPHGARWCQPSCRPRLGAHRLHPGAEPGHCLVSRMCRIWPATGAFALPRSACSWAPGRWCGWGYSCWPSPTSPWRWRPVLALPAVNGPVLAALHAVLLVLLWQRARRTDPEQPAQMARFYRFVWSLFYAEYVVFPLACLLA
jgi:homogentisate phytyltransferase / homogentisate geranylgeranyltransferase